MKSRLLLLLMVSTIASPAAAEKFATVWTFKPITSAPPTTVQLDQTFFVQRPVPYRLVKLNEDVTLGKSKAIAAGTPLYLVLDKSNRMAFCTFKDNSAGNAAKSLFIPALDTRPCFIDDDKDGKFEKTFSVFELWGSVAPTPKGDMKKAKAVKPVAYSEADPSETPTEYRLAFEVHSKGNDRVPELRFKFSGKNESLAQAYPSERVGDAFVANPFNYKVSMKLIGTQNAEVLMTPTGENVMVVLFDKYTLMKPEEFPMAKVGKK